MQDSIPELVKAFSDGDNQAFAILVKRYQRKIYAVAYQMLGNHLDADEVVQETFVRIYHKRQELKHVSNFSSFLIRVAANYSIDLLRKRKIHGELSDDPASLPGNIQISMSRRVRTPRELYEDKTMMEEIIKALEQLPPRQKITAVLHDIEGFSKTEIAAILECPEATVRSNLHIARAKLKKILKNRLSKE